MFLRSPKTLEFIAIREKSERSKGEMKTKSFTQQPPNTIYFVQSNSITRKRKINKNKLNWEVIATIPKPNIVF